MWHLASEGLFALARRVLSLGRQPQQTVPSPSDKPVFRSKPSVDHPPDSQVRLKVPNVRIETERLGDADAIVVRGPIAERLLHRTFVCLCALGVCVSHSEVRIENGESIQRLWITDSRGGPIGSQRWRNVLSELVSTLAAPQAPVSDETRRVSGLAS